MTLKARAQYALSNPSIGLDTKLLIRDLQANNKKLCEVLEAVDSEIVLGGQIKELVDEVLSDAS